MPDDCNCEMIFVLITALHIYLPHFNCFNCVVVIFFCLIVPALEYVNKLVYSMRAHRNTWGRVSQAGKRVRKRDDEVQTLRNIWDIWHACQQIGRWTMAVLLCMCSGFSTEILEQMIMTSLYDITRVSHATEGGNYKRRA